ncbi:MULTISPECIES: hypothetical protein [unclassified Spirosoma]|uniref:hypothetical protein n=1 Tax=unclassified Spirosoma TaxID=2621999 RepID=UPI000962AEB8|nr:MULTISPECIES: hypothetical protein [unclassified Spirosoma]MBN8826095.1 hypothetical protein [Spirosoma sp.]OJW74582.1 MAG: hypothetical protein BGO59_20285 [Spirosoma sp. 48-14]
MSQQSRYYWQIQFAYLAGSCLCLALLLWLPKNQEWLMSTVERFYNQRQRLASQTSLSARLLEGYGDAYTFTSLIQQRCGPDDYFLIPPQQYLIRNAWQQGKETGYVWLYPSVLYYHLGKSVHLIDMTTPDSLLQRATHTFWAYDNKLFLLTFKPHNRPLVLSEFRKYDPHFFAYTPDQARRYHRSKP